MLRVMQTRPGTPRGDCRAACYASIFELALDDFPDTRWPEAIPWQGGQDATLTARGDAARAFPR